MNSTAFQQCMATDCGAQFDLAQVLTACPNCDSLLDIRYDWNRVDVPSSLADFEQFWNQRRDPTRLSGVWRFRELLPFANPEKIVTVGEGQTLLQRADRLCRENGLQPGNLYLQYEGLNPSGSFKDNGMTAAVTHAHSIGARMAACASTGNTSASLAMYAAHSGLMKALVFVGSGKIAYGKLSQALDFGATTIQIRGDFDDAMNQVRTVCRDKGIYLVNSINPFRLEGQKTIMLRVLEGLKWQVPDWIVVPGGNLGNSSSFGKMFGELFELGLIDRAPRLAIVNAAGANTLSTLVNELKIQSGQEHSSLTKEYLANLGAADTLASAIEINQPVNLPKCLRALHICNGVVCEVSDQEIVDCKARIGATGFGCEPASAASLAGVRQLTENGTIAADEKVVCILTGHQLKDPDVTVAYHSGDEELFQQKLASRRVRETRYRNQPFPVDNETGKIVSLIENLMKESTA